MLQGCSVCYERDGALRTSGGGLIASIYSQIHTSCLTTVHWTCGSSTAYVCTLGACRARIPSVAWNDNLHSRATVHAIHVARCRSSLPADGTGVCDAVHACIAPCTSADAQEFQISGKWKLGSVKKSDRFQTILCLIGCQRHWMLVCTRNFMFEYGPAAAL